MLPTPSNEIWRVTLESCSWVAMSLTTRWVRTVGLAYKPKQKMVRSQHHVQLGFVAGPTMITVYHFSSTVLFRILAPQQAIWWHVAWWDGRAASLRAVLESWFPDCGSIPPIPYSWLLIHKFLRPILETCSLFRWPVPLIPRPWIL